MEDPFPEYRPSRDRRSSRDGRLVGITLLHPKLLLAEDRRVVIPTDHGVLEAGPETLEPALAAAAR